MCRYPECGSRLPPVQLLDLAVQGLLVHVAVDGVVNLHHRSQRALPEAGNRAQRKAAIGRGGADFVGPVLALLGQPQLEPEPLQKVARAARVTRRAAADADGVVALRLQVEEREESDHAIDLRQRNIRLLGNVLQDSGRKVFMWMMFLNSLQDSEQRSGSSRMREDGAIREVFFLGRQRGR